MAFGKRWPQEPRQSVRVVNPYENAAKPAAAKKTRPSWQPEPPPQSEYDLQKSCHQHFRQYCPSLCWEVEGPNGLQEAGLGWMNKNDGKKSKQAAGKDKAQGLTPGVPDYQVAVARRGYHGLYVEFKTDTGSTSKAQDKMHTALIAQGYLVIVCRSLENFGKLLAWYLGPQLYRLQWQDLSGYCPTR